MQKSKPMDAIEAQAGAEMLAKKEEMMLNA